MLNKNYIGGSFEIDVSKLAMPVCQEPGNYFGFRKNDVLLNTGRAAFRSILKALNLGKNRILLPDFLCEEAFLPVAHEESVDFIFYPINRRLRPIAEELEKAVKDGAGAILLINFFGLKDVSKTAQAIRRLDSSIKIIVDNVQALFCLKNGEHVTDFADFEIYSFRKFLAVPDGAFVRNNTDFPLILEKGVCDDFSLYMIGAILRNALLSGSTKPSEAEKIENSYLGYFDAATKSLPTYSAPPSYYFKELIRRYPLDHIASRRRENYIFLAEALTDCADVNVIEAKLSDAVVPLSLPIFVKNGSRDLLKNYLQKQNIFCPIHWPQNENGRRTLSDDVKYISSHILSLPIDQRYCQQDLIRIADEMKSFFKSAAGSITKLSPELI